MTPIPVRLEAFEGPLDLLLHLIDKNKINIYDIPVSEITDQYLAYVDQMKEENMEVTSEFLVMAATLLDLKSRMLLPREEEEEEEEGDPREELVQRLLDYKLTKYQSEELRDKSEEASRNVFRNQDLPKEVKNYQPPVDYDELLGRTTLQSLTKIFEDVLKRQKNRMDPVRSTFGRIEKEEISVEEKTSQLMEYFRHCEKTSFRALLEGQTSRQGLIVTFLILLDFIKSGIVHIRQGEIFGEIEIFAGALPEGGMGPQEILPSNKAEARALRKAKKKQEKEEALSAKADLPDETEPDETEADETEPAAEEKEIAVESSHYYKPRVVLSLPRADAENPASLEDAQAITVKAEEQEKPSEQEEKESAAGLPEKEAADLEDTAAEQEASEEEPAEEELSEEESSEEEPVEKELSEEVPAEEEPYEEEPAEEEDDDPAAEEDFEESEGSAVYRLIQSKDWETVLDEYMEDEGLAELLEEEKKIPKEDTDPVEEEPEEEEDFETEEEPEAEAERVSESEEDFGAEEEAESEEFPEVEGVPEVEEKAQAREVSEAEEEPEEDFEAEEAPEEGEVPEAEEEPKSEEIPEIKQDSEEEAVPSPEESVEETWKQAESPQPSRLYYSPWAVQWRYQKSPQPWKSQKKKPGRQWKRSARSSTMRKAVFRSIAMMMPYSSRPGQNTTNT